MNLRVSMLALLAGWVALSPVGALERPTLEVGTGLLYGQSYELVLRDGTFNDPISRLIWPTPPSALAEAGLEERWTDWTSTRLWFRTAWPFLTGTVVDEDWRAPDQDLVYGHSTHTGYMTSFVEAQADQGLQWQDWTFWAGLGTRWTSWEAWNGSGTYQSSTGTTSTAFSGAVLDYHQLWLLPSLGLQYDWPLEGMLWRPSLRWGPYLWCFDRDDHNYYGKVTTTFIDSPHWGELLSAAIDCLTTDHWGLRWEATGTMWSVGDTVITTTQKTSGATYVSNTNAAGAWFWETSLTFFVRN